MLLNLVAYPLSYLPRKWGRRFLEILLFFVEGYFFSSLSLPPRVGEKKYNANPRNINSSETPLSFQQFLYDGFREQNDRYLQISRWHLEDHA